MMQKLKQRTDEMCSRLNGDISRIRTQKVRLGESLVLDSGYEALTDSQACM